MDIYTGEQGTDDWFKVRSGVPTASMFSAVLAKGAGKTRRAYMLKLLGERLTGEIEDGFSTIHTDRGTELEPKARILYEFQTENKVDELGFVRNGNCGASPDGIIGEDGILEIKTKLPHLQLDVLLRDEMPTTHKPQVQGCLMVLEREWCDFVSYWPNLPLFIKRIYRDEVYIKNLVEEIELFNEEMAKLEQQIKEM